MKKFLSCALMIFVLMSLAAFSASAQTKIIKKTVKKIVTPNIAPVEAPEPAASKEVAPVEPPPPPPPPPDYDAQLPETDKGLLGWGLNTDVAAKLLYGSILLGARGDIVFSDPLKIGEKIGLAEDAVEYKTGLGLVIADTFKSIPLYADAVVYLKEGSMFGMDGFIGTGLIFNLYGTGKVSGGLGGQIYTGILADLGLDSRTAISLGYATYKVGNDISDSGIFINIAQPIKL
ncbi:MAG: hypothetical protein JW782_00080 [Candidatus Saganbacteria bacterium]|nr:hypothetical protein [Candidatus Saganbacteria bacterium]